MLEIRNTDFDQAVLYLVGRNILADKKQAISHIKILIFAVIT